MLITCKCLNLSINTSTADLIRVDTSILELSSNEESEAFFQESVGRIDPVNITKEQPGLLQVRSVNNWTLHYCLNCKSHTHGIKRDNTARIVLVNLDLITDFEEIVALKSSDKYSTAFKIIINHLNVDPESLPSINKFTVSQQPDPLQLPLNSLQQQLTECIQREVQSTEQRIRVYSEREYAQLEEFRERIHREHRLLANVVTQFHLSKSNPTSPTIPSPSLTSSPLLPYTPTSQLTSRTAMTPTSPNNPNFNTGVLLSNKTDKDTTRIVSYGNSKSYKSFHNDISYRQSMDSEGLFDLEGMEGLDNCSDTSDVEREEDSGGETSADEGLQINRARFKQKVNESTIARSLPISVPAFIGPNKLQEIDSDSDMMPHESGVDIAASIKALAKSVHGDAVFGDLPRPRFSTQI